MFTGEKNIDVKSIYLMLLISTINIFSSKTNRMTYVFNFQALGDKIKIFTHFELQNNLHIFIIIVV